MVSYFFIIFDIFIIFVQTKGQNIVDKFKKLNKIDFPMECFTYRLGTCHHFRDFLKVS